MNTFIKLFSQALDQTEKLLYTSSVQGPDPDPAFIFYQGLKSLLPPPPPPPQRTFSS
jgi:hypothetical protein